MENNGYTHCFFDEEYINFITRIESLVNNKKYKDVLELLNFSYSENKVKKKELANYTLFLTQKINVEEEEFIDFKYEVRTLTY